jgi:hypothetical protein
MPDSPTIAELTRLVDRLAEQVTALIARLDRERDEHQRVFLPRELWNAMHQADAAVIADLASDIRGCRDATSIAIERVETNVSTEIHRVETKLDTFNAEYDRDRRDDKTRHDEDARAEKARKQNLTLTVVIFAIGLLANAVLSILALLNGR